MEGKVKKYVDPYATSLPPLRYVLPESIDPSSLIIQISTPGWYVAPDDQEDLKENPGNGDGNQTLPPAADRQQEAKPDK